MMHSKEMSFPNLIKKPELHNLKEEEFKQMQVGIISSVCQTVALVLEDIYDPRNFRIFKLLGEHAVTLYKQDRLVIKEIAGI
jgi:hypothetical protein